MKILILAEKNDVVKKIKEALPKAQLPYQVDFVAFNGHIMTLKQPNDYKQEWANRDISLLPIIPEKFEYAPNPARIDAYKRIKEKVKNGNYDFLVNACDAGREGQLIFFSFYDEIGCKIPVKRLWLKVQTQSFIVRELQNLRDESEAELSNLTLSSKCRAMMDWLIGMNASRAVTSLAKTNVPVGRVMTPLLNIFVQQEKRIQSFVSKNFYEVEATFDGYKGLYFNPDKKNEQGKAETRFDTKEEAEALIQSLPNEGTVASVESKEMKEYAPALYDLPSLQSDGDKIFGYSLKDTLGIAQTLYEQGYISYPRSDFKHLASSTAQLFPALLKSAEVFSELQPTVQGILQDPSVIESIKKNKSYVDDKKIGDHEGITPTEEVPNLSSLGEKERNIYYLICRRFVSIFLPPCIQRQSTIVTKAGDHLFKTTGKVLVDKGWRNLVPLKSNDVILPPVQESQTVAVQDTNVKAGKTTPPKRYQESNVIDIMSNINRLVEDKESADILKEAKGLGTAATRDSIFEKLITLEMIKKEKKDIYATPFGIAVIDLLNDHPVTKVELTADWEQKLRQIEEGTLSAKAFYQEMLTFIKEIVAEFQAFDSGILAQKQKEMAKAKPRKEGSSNGSQAPAKFIGQCPMCKKKQVKETAKYYLCEDYKQGCDFILGKEIQGAKISATNAKKIITNKETSELTFVWKSGKKGTAKLRWENNKLAFVFATATKK